MLKLSFNFHRNKSRGMPWWASTGVNRWLNPFNIFKAMWSAPYFSSPISGKSRLFCSMSGKPKQIVRRCLLSEDVFFRFRFFLVRFYMKLEVLIEVFLDAPRRWSTQRCGRSSRSSTNASMWGWDEVAFKTKWHMLGLLKKSWISSQDVLMHALVFGIFGRKTCEDYAHGHCFFSLLFWSWFLLDRAHWNKPFEAKVHFQEVIPMPVMSPGTWRPGSHFHGWSRVRSSIHIYTILHNSLYLYGSRSMIIKVYERL